MTRRKFNALAASAAATLATGSRSRAQPTTRPTTWLLFTKSSGFEHDVIKRTGDAPSFLARHLAPLFVARGLAMTESKDGRLFEPAAIGRFGGFVFYTTGDLTTEGTDKQPPMSAAGKGALLAAVEAGTPFIGIHSASDTFREDVDGKPDPYTRMLGGRFAAHGEQQVGVVGVADAAFPGAYVGWADDFGLREEWYALDALGDDLRRIHVLKTAGLKGDMYRRDPYPITWTRRHSEGRVFYTALGHREDVIASERFRRLIGGAVDWCRGAVP